MIKFLDLTQISKSFWQGSTHIRVLDDLSFRFELRQNYAITGASGAGKSTLLSSITAAKPKIADYAFTTLVPQLGMVDYRDGKSFCIADLPGIIEGAAEGKGLGHKFLRHISRTKMILHCISCENDDPLFVYKTVRAELGKYDPALLEKPEVILLTKTDMIDQATLKKNISLFSKSDKKILTVSIFDDSLVKKLSEELVKVLKSL